MNLKFSIIGAIAALAFINPVASAEEPIDCSAGNFGVYGYPKQERVPEGYIYPGTPGGIFSHQAGGYNKGQREGAQNLIDAVDKFAAACPESPIHLYGHSYGAAIVHTALETIDQRDYAPRVTVKLTGDPREIGGIEDTYAGSSLPGITFRGAGIIPENVLDFHSECNNRDAICAIPSLSSDSLGHGSAVLGYFTGAHRYG